MNYIGTLILIQVSLIVLWETTGIILMRMGVFQSSYMVMFLMMLSAFAFVKLKKHLNKIQKELT